ncbi:MFS transporter [Kribbella sp. NPDC003505]|uniref:MFS transporter n=1 Tax=Kribbella sp. NPDC003505 TaxID=3154448 RepID=UPI0033B3F1FC
MQLTKSVGEGCTAVVLVLYLMRVRDLDGPTTALLVTLAGVGGMLGSVVIGKAGDRIGHRTAIRWSALCAALGLLAIVLVPTVWLLAASLFVVAAADRGLSAARNAVVMSLPIAARVQLRAYLRVVLNVGSTAGALAGGAAAAVDAEPAYVGALLLDACTFAALLVIAGRLPLGPQTEVRRPPAGSRSTGGQPVHRNLYFLSAMAILAWFSVNFETMGLVVAVWLIGVHAAPPWTASLALVVNTAIASSFQLRIARRVTDVGSAARAIWISSVWIAAGFGILAFVPSLPRTATVALVVLVVVAALLHAVGDMLGSAGQWEIIMSLAEPSRPGEYQGAAGLLVDGCRAVAPQVVTLTLVEHGPGGMLVLMLSFVLAAGSLRLVIPRKRLPSLRTGDQQVRRESSDHAGGGK